MIPGLTSTHIAQLMEQQVESVIGNIKQFADTVGKASNAFHAASVFDYSGTGNVGRALGLASLDRKAWRAFSAAAYETASDLTMQSVRPGAGGSATDTFAVNIMSAVANSSLPVVSQLAEEIAQPRDRTRDRVMAVLNSSARAGVKFSDLSMVGVRRMARHFANEEVAARRMQDNISQMLQEPEFLEKAEKDSTLSRLGDMLGELYIGLTSLGEAVQSSTNRLDSLGGTTVSPVGNGMGK